VHTDENVLSITSSTYNVDISYLNIYNMQTSKNKLLYVEF